VGPARGLQRRVWAVEHIGDDDTLALLGIAGIGGGAGAGVVDKVPDLAKDTDGESLEVEIERCVSLGGCERSHGDAGRTYLGDTRGGSSDEQVDERVEAGLVEGGDGLGETAQTGLVDGRGRGRRAVWAVEEGADLSHGWWGPVALVAGSSERLGEQVIYRGRDATTTQALGIIQTDPGEGSALRFWAFAEDMRVALAIRIND
jgi:hypothetical protein